MDWRSSNFCSLEVVKRSHRIGRSSFYFFGEWSGRHHGWWAGEQGGCHTSMPEPLSVICSNFRPPSFTRTSSDVEPASTAFSINSFSAWTGATMISPAAILLTTS